MSSVLAADDSFPTPSIIKYLFLNGRRRQCSASCSVADNSCYL